jgi:uncharacterized protein (TIGR02145 family)
MRTKLSVRAENFQPQLATAALIRQLLAAIFGLAITFTLSCSGGDDNDGGGDGSSSSSEVVPSSSSVGNNISGYKTVEIGDQVWMAENLNYAVSGSVCYNNDEANCATYGRLYNWATAKTVCPFGWHLPSDAEWITLIDYVEAQKSCTYCAGEYLKSTNGWNEDGNGTDDYGFAALSGGYGSSGYFYDAGDDGYWWSAREANVYGGVARYMYYNFEYVYEYYNYKDDLLSVRCVQD